MPVLNATKPAQLSPQLAAEADAIAARVDALGKDMNQICIDVATSCSKRDRGTVYAFLQRAFPQESNKGRRLGYLFAGRMMQEGIRRRIPFEFGWSVAAEAYSLPDDGWEWFFEDKRTLKQVRERKRLTLERTKQGGQKGPLPVENSTPSNSIRSTNRGSTDDKLATLDESATLGSLSGFRFVEHVKPGTDPEFVAAMELACQLYEILERRCLPEERSWSLDDFWHLRGQVKNCLVQLQAQVDYREDTRDDFGGDAIDVDAL